MQYVNPTAPDALSGQIRHVALSLSIILPHQFKLLLPIRTSQTCLQPSLCVLVVPLEKAKYNMTMKGLISKAALSLHQSTAFLNPARSSLLPAVVE